MPGRLRDKTICQNLDVARVPSRAPRPVTFGGEDRSDAAPTQPLSSKLKDPEKCRVLTWMGLKVDPVCHELKSEGDRAHALVPGFFYGQSGLGPCLDHAAFKPRRCVHDSRRHFGKRIIAGDPLYEGEGGTPSSKLALDQL